MTGDHSASASPPAAGLLASVGLLIRTSPYLLVRLMILSCAATAGLLWWGLGVGGGVWVMAKVHPYAGAAVIGGCMLGFAVVWWVILRPLLYLVQCGHIAVMTQKIVGGAVGLGGLNMLLYGYRAVKANFGTMRDALELDEHVRDTVYSFASTGERLAGAIPLPGAGAMASALGIVVKTAAEYLDETILSYTFSRPGQNPFESSADGLIYFAQNHTQMLKTALGVVVLDRILRGLLWLSLTVACGALAYAFLPFEDAWTLFSAALEAFGASTGSISGKDQITQIFLCAAVAFPLGLVLTRVAHHGLLHPLFLAMIATRFHATIHGQALDRSWEDKLKALGSDFEAIQRMETAWGRASRLV